MKQMQLFVVIIALTISQVLFSNNYIFTENKGQWNENVLYRTQLDFGNIYYEQNRWLFDMAIIEENHHCEIEDYCSHHAMPTKFHAFAINFLNSNKQSQIVPENEDTFYTNYFIGNNPNKWASYVKQYKFITYKEIYEGVDLKISDSDIGSIKYQFELQKGIDASQIQMNFDGVDYLRIYNEDLLIGLSTGEVMDLAPQAWQMINGEVNFVKVEYQLDKGVLSFNFPNGYDKNYALIIDPTLIFATYSGSNGSNYGYSATYDLYENSYGGSIALQSGYPVTTGAYDTGYNGGWDDAITKFSADGTQNLFSTYIGSGGEDNPVSLMVNSNNELVILTITDSNNFPTTSGAYDTSPNGNYDLAISILSEDGASLIASTMFGGSGNDGYNDVGDFTPNYGMQRRGEVFVGENDTIYITSIVRSSNIATTGAYDTTKGGNHDAIVAKFSPDLSTLFWATYFGGSSSDSGSGVKVGKNYEVYLVGGTKSTNLPTTTGAIIPNYQGGNADGYIAKFSSDGSQLLACTYQGTNLYDQTFFVDVDKDGDVYTFGNALGSYDHPPNYGFSNLPYAMNFIHKLDPTLQNTIYNHNFGTASNFDNNLVPTALSVDICNRAYISGTTVGQFGCNFPTTADAIYQQGLGAPNCQDFFIMVLSPDGQDVEYGTFFGSSGWDHVDAGTSRFSPNGFIHQAVCSNGGIPTTPGVVSSSPQAGWNLAVFKIDMEPVFTVADAATQPNPAEGCAPFTVTFSNPLDTPGDYMWDFNDGTGNTSTDETPTYTFENPGTFDVMLMITDSTTCNIRDSSFVQVTVYDDLEIVQPNFGYNIVGGCGSTQVEFINYTVDSVQNPISDYIFTWDFDGLATSNDVNPIYTFPSDGTYNVSIDVESTNPNSLPAALNGCFFALNFDVDVVVPSAYDLDADISSNAIDVCALEPIDFAALVNEGNPSQYTWDLGDGSSLVNDSSFSYQYNAPGSYNVQLTVDDPESCNGQVVENVTINVDNSLETILPDFSNDLPTNCQFLEVNFTNLTTFFDDISQYTFTWDFGDGNTSTDINPIHVYDNLGNYSVSLSIAGLSDCKTPGSVTLPVNIDIDNTVLADFSMDDLVCAPYSKLLEAAEQTDSMAWLVNGSVVAVNQTTYQFDQTQSGTYDVQLVVIDSTSCNISDNAEYSIEIRDIPTAQFTLQPETILIGDDVQVDVVNPSNEANYSWNFGDGNTEFGTSAQHIYGDIGIFQVCLTARDNVLSDCLSESCKTVEVKVDYFINIPTAFSPNNDGFNDVFRPLVYNVDEYDYWLYNRWGEQVFHGDEASAGWDGKHKGELQEIGVYMLYFEAKLKTGQVYSDKGNVTLIR